MNVDMGKGGWEGPWVCDDGAWWDWELSKAAGYGHARDIVSAKLTTKHQLITLVKSEWNMGDERPENPRR